MEFFYGIFQQGDVLSIPYRGREVVLDDGFFFAAPESAEQKDAAGDSRLPQPDSFIGPGDAEPTRTFRFQPFGAFGGSVAVGIGLHHGADCSVRSNVIQNGSKVMAKGGQ